MPGTAGKDARSADRRLPRQTSPCYNRRMSKLIMIVVCFCLIGWVVPAQAQYVLTLKNGRQLTVQSYRDEGTMVKIFGLGGELGIPKDQIVSISKSGESTRPGLNMIEMDSDAGREKAQEPSVPSEPSNDAAVSEETKGNDLAEATEYRKKFAEVTRKLEAAKEEYFKATQGGGTASNLTKEGISAWTMDLASRIHDSQKVRGGGGPVSTPPTPPYTPQYTAQEKKLSELRTAVDALQKQRDALVGEMESKNIPIP